MIWNVRDSEKKKFFSNKSTSNCSIETQKQQWFALLFGFALSRFFFFYLEMNTQVAAFRFHSLSRVGDLLGVFDHYSSSHSKKSSWRKKKTLFCSTQKPTVSNLLRIVSMPAVSKKNVQKGTKKTGPKKKVKKHFEIGLFGCKMVLKTIEKDLKWKAFFFWKKKNWNQFNCIILYILNVVVLTTWKERMKKKKPFFFSFFLFSNHYSI